MEYDKLHKVTPSVTSLLEKFLQLYNPHKENSIDEASSLKQCMPNKPIKRGLKVWCRCDSKMGSHAVFRCMRVR